MTGEHDAAPRGPALAGLVAGACIIGFVPAAVRLADAGPAAIGFWRLAFALPLLVLLNRRSLRKGAAPPVLALVAGAMFALDLAFWHYGIAYTSVANATVLANLTPLVVTLIAWIFLGQRPARLFLAAVAIAVAGAALMALGKGGPPGRAPLLGDLLSAATAIWYALYMISIGQARKESGAGAVMLWSTVSAMPVLLAAALILDEALLPATPMGWTACAVLGLLHVCGQGAIAWALGRLPTATASVVVLIQPVVAALLGWSLFSETPGPLQALGALSALGGVVLAQWATRPRAPA